jgi:hypothetical protein
MATLFFFFKNEIKIKIKIKIVGLAFWATWGWPTTPKDQMGKTKKIKKIK